MVGTGGSSKGFNGKCKGVGAGKMSGTGGATPAPVGSSKGFDGKRKGVGMGTMSGTGGTTPAPGGSSKGLDGKLKSVGKCTDKGSDGKGSDGKLKGIGKCTGVSKGSDGKDVTDRVERKRRKKFLTKVLLDGILSKVRKIEDDVIALRDELSSVSESE